MTDNNKKEASEENISKKMALVSVQAGCLTLIVAGIALSAGLLIDARLGTAPQWTIIFLLGSMPLAFGGVFWLIRQMIKERSD
jgi:F0F1-type ATP synthase assembly protein I